MKPAIFVLVAGSALAAHMLVRAESGGSLYDSRLGVIKGTSPGIVVIGPGRNSQAPAVAASSASASAAGSTPLAERTGALLKWGEPPSGQALNAAKRLDSPAQGITLPSSGSASQPAGKVPPKPGG